MTGGMPPAPAGGTLPYGTSPSDPHAPWNAPEAGTWTDVDVIDYVEDELLGDIVYEDESGWIVEAVDTPGRRPVHAGPFDSRDAAVSYCAAENDATIERLLDERERDRIADGYYEPDY